MNEASDTKESFMSIRLRVCVQGVQLGVYIPYPEPPLPQARRGLGWFPDDTRYMHACMHVCKITLKR